MANNVISRAFFTINIFSGASDEFIVPNFRVGYFGTYTLYTPRYLYTHRYISQHVLIQPQESVLSSLVQVKTSVHPISPTVEPPAAPPPSCKPRSSKEAPTHLLRKTSNSPSVFNKNFSLSSSSLSLLSASESSGRSGLSPPPKWHLQSCSGARVT